MIEFVSLYLGLLTGLQPVEVVVSPEVATVEILLDGTSMANLSSEPWYRKIDFGPRLQPRRLEAVAYDHELRELGRVEQIVNLPRPAAEASVVLDRNETGRVVAARLSWQSLARKVPLEVTATLDGILIPVEDPQLISIPDHDPKAYHLLVFDLRFSRRDTVQVVAGFGGGYFGEATTELTAVPVITRRRRLPSLSELQGSVLMDGQPLPVISADKGPANLLFVRDASADKIIRSFGREARGVGGFGVTSATGVTSSPSGISGVAASPYDELRRMLTLDSDVDIRLMWPATKQVHREEVEMNLFPASPPMSAGDGGVFWALTQDVILDQESDIQRLTDALAVAGVEAVREGRRRAVVMVLGPEPVDASQYDAGIVRSYLRSLKVPLYVWGVAKGGKKKKVSYPEWGEVTTITSLNALRRAVRELEDDLERQRILWVGGRHLPQALTVKTGTRLAPVVGEPAD